jgi:hypothetical protein
MSILKANFFVSIQAFFKGKGLGLGLSFILLEAFLAY